MKPIIGITPLYDLELESLWMLDIYMDAVRYFGGIPCILPLEADSEDMEKIVNTFDGFIFSGGPDLDPCYYNEDKKNTCGTVVEIRDKFEMDLLDEVLKADKPFLGICRGLQLLNAKLGGTLYQDLKTEFESPVNHDQEKPYDEFKHSIIVNKEADKLGIFQAEEFPVSTLHHQAIKGLGEGLVSIANSEDGLIEAIYKKGSKYCVGVQWHPEYIYKTSPESANIFKSFIEASAK